MKPLWRDRVAVARSQGMGSQVAPAMGRWISEANRTARPDLVARCARLIEATPVEGYGGWCAAIEAMDMGPFLPRITAPALVMAGALDPATPVSASEGIAAGIRGARLVVIPDVAHMIAIEDPGAFLSEIDPFLWRTLKSH
jgi:3-oxoadipate enol-lactonase